MRSYCFFVYCGGVASPTHLWLRHLHLQCWLPWMAVHCGWLRIAETCRHLRDGCEMCEMCAGCVRCVRCAEYVRSLATRRLPNLPARAKACNSAWQMHVFSRAIAVHRLAHTIDTTERHTFIIIICLS